MSSTDNGRDPRTVDDQERISLGRRAVFAFGTTMCSFGLVVAVLWLEPESSLGEKIIGSVMSYAELMAMLYLGASVIDRTKLVDKFTARFDTYGAEAQKHHTAQPEEQYGYRTAPEPAAYRPDPYDERGERA